MKKTLSYLGVLFTAYLGITHASAQAPVISYSPSTNVFIVGVAITPLTPTNSGGAVPVTTYSTVSTLVAAGAGLNNPRGLAPDGAGNIYETDNNSIINKISSTGVVTLLTGKSGFSSEKDGNASSARLNGPWGIVYDGATYLYVCDNAGNTIRRVTVASGQVTTVAGSGTAGEADATGTAATFSGPMGIAYDGSTYLYVCDNGGNKIRRVTVATGAVLTIAGSGTASETNNTTGTSATFNGPAGIVYDGAGNLYVSDAGGNTIRKISTTAPYAVTTFAGTGSSGSANGTGTAASFNAPYGLTKDASGNIIVADEGNNLVRIITPSAVVTTLAGNGTKAELNGIGTAAEFFSPYSVAADNSGNLFAGDNNAANSTYRKILLTGYTISPTTLPTGLSFDGTTGIISGTPTASFVAANFTITGYNASGSSSSVINITCKQIVNWTSGSNTNNWNTAGNWSTGLVPGAADDVHIGVIAYTNANEPVIPASTSVNSIIFGSVHAATLTLGTGVTLTVKNNITVNTGSTPAITGGSATTSIIDMAPGSIVNVNGTGILTLTSPLNFTLQSDATGDASIGQITSTSIAGSAASSINVQRYLTGGAAKYRGFRLISSPVTSGSGDYTINYLKKSIYITSTITTGGFDNVVPANPTIYIYRENLTNPSNATFTASNFRSINNITTSPVYGLDDTTYPTTNIPIGNGILCFFRGDRNIGQTFAQETVTTYVPTSTTLTASGTLNIGNITVKDWFTPASLNLSYTAASPYAGFNLVGNPYASAIDWDTFQSTSIATGGIYGASINSNSMYILDPSSHNYGVYMSGTGGVGTNNATNIISSGQGFFVKAASTSAQLVFTESAKTSSQNTGSNLTMGRPVNLASNQYFRLRLAKDSINADETMIRFNSGATTNFDEKFDAIYRIGYGSVSLAGVKSDKVNFAIGTIPLPQQQCETIGLNVNANTDGIYSLSLKDVVAVPRLYDVWLMDAYKKDSLEMRQNKIYNFNIYKKDSASFGPKRFTLVIRQNAAFAYRLLSFSAEKMTDARQVQIIWNTANEGNYTNFTIQKSIDGGKTFNVIGGVTATGAGEYAMTDKSPVLGQNLYRLEQEDINGTITYSNVVNIQYSDLSNSLVSNKLSIYPNPVINNISLNIADQATDNTTYNIKFMNSSGIVIKQVTSAQSTWEGNVSNLQPGTYIVQVLNGKNETLVGQTKFVKL